MHKQKRFAVLLLVLLSFSCVSFGKPTQVVYLIPEGFTGGVIVAYNQPDGITPETTKDGTIIFQVPKDGLIKVKEPLEKADYKFSYYFVDDKGTKTPIEYLYPKYSGGKPGDPTSRDTDAITENESNNKIFATDHTTSNFSIGGEKIYVYSFLIEKPVLALQTFLQTQDKVFNIQKELLRKNKVLKEQQKSANE